MTTVRSLAELVCGGQRRWELVTGIREATRASFSYGVWQTKRLCTILSEQAADLETEKLAFGVRLSCKFAGHGHYVGLPQSQDSALRTIAMSRVDDVFDDRTVSESCGDADHFSKDRDLVKEVKIDLQLPRRRLSVEFTCNVCQTRTQRIINPDAYKRGTVYVKCGGCESYHQLVDNLGLVVEYDFREDSDLELS